MNRQNTAEVHLTRMYRTPEEIRRDMKRIHMAIEETTDMLNTRNLIVEALTAMAMNHPETWIPAIEELLEEARAALARLETLECALLGLREEIEEVKEVILQ